MKGLSVFFCIIITGFFCVSCGGADGMSPVSSVDDLGYHKALYVSDSVPDTLEAGMTYPVGVTMMNIGLVSWEHDVELFGLLCEGVDEALSADPSFIPLPDGSAVSSGSSYTFPFLLIPNEQGNHTLSFLVVLKKNNQYIPIQEPVTREIQVLPKNGISSPEYGAIRVDVKQKGTRISLNGKYTGISPLILADITPGHYTLTLDYEGFDPVFIELDVSPLSVTEVVVDMTMNRIPEVFIQHLSSSDPFVTSIVGFVEYLWYIIIFSLLILSAGVLIVARSSSVKKHLVVENLQSVSNGEDAEFVLGALGVSPPELKGSDLHGIQMTSVCERGPNGFLLFRIENLGAHMMYIEGEEIRPGGQKVVRLRVDAHEDGFYTLQYQIPCRDARGRPYFQSLSVSYTVTSLFPVLESLLEALEITAKSATARVIMRNTSIVSAFLGDEELKPGESTVISCSLDSPVSSDYYMKMPIQWTNEIGVSFSHTISVPYNMGRLFFAQNRLHEALDYFKEMLQKNPDNTDAWLWIGFIHEKLHKTELAANAFYMVLQQDSDNKEAQDHLNALSHHDNQLPPAPKTDITQEILLFPDVLRALYDPVAFIYSDTSTEIFSVRRKGEETIRALKVLHDSLSGSSVLVEASVWRSLHHQHIVELYRYNKKPVLYFEMEYVGGTVIDNKTISSVAGIHLPAPLHLVMAIVSGVADAVAYLHHQGVPHLHIRPGTILLDSEVNPKLTGFICDLQKEQNKSEIRFFSPEQVFVEEYGKVGKKTDVYQIGVLLYYLLTGSIPYHKGCTENFSLFTDSELILPSYNNPSLSFFDDLLKNSLSLRKAERTITPEEIRDYLHTKNPFGDDLD